MDDRGFFLTILDLDSLTYRDIRNELVNYPLRIKWLDRGCKLEIRGHITDLHGSILQSPSPLVPDDRVGNYGGTILSPDGKWLASSIYYGQMTRDSSTHVDVEIISLEEQDLSARLSHNGGAHSFSWSPDGQWLAFGDFDEQGILQLYRASIKDQTIEQLTDHTELSTVISPIVWSNDGQKIAFGVEVFPNGVVEEIIEASDARVSIVTILDSSLQNVSSLNLGFIGDLWWNEDGSRLVFTGTVLPEFQNDANGGRQIHWLNANTGEIERSFLESDAPGGSFTIALAVGDIDTFFISAYGGYYLLDGKTKSTNILGEFAQTEDWNRILDVTSDPFEYPGEDNCDYQ